MNTLTKVSMNNVSTRLQIALAALGLIVLSACGGGGGDDGGSSPSTVATPTTTPPATTPPPATTTPPPATTPDPVPDPSSLDDLTVDPDNMLQSVFELAIDIDLGSSERAYFSLCDQFQNQGGDYKVNYNSCLFRGALTDGKLNSAIKVANHQTELLAVLWKYDGSAPRFQLWQHHQGTNPKLIINN